MDADLKGALAQINKSYKAFEHNGKKMSKTEVRAVLNYGISKGYTKLSDLSCQEVDEVLKSPFIKLHTLQLTLTKSAFEVMVTGEKNEEYREWSSWISSRLFDMHGTPKQYDFVKFKNGYSQDRPYFIAKFRHFIRLIEDEPTKTIRAYSNGLIVPPLKTGDFIIFLGEIVETGNLK